MFEVKPVNVGDVPNDGDIFHIACSRKEMFLLFDAIQLRVDRFDYADMNQKIMDAIY